MDATAKHERTVFLGRPQVQTRQVADPKHRYRVAVDFDTFSSEQHAVTLDENGILTSADSTVNNAAAEVGFELFKSAMAVVGGVVGAPASPLPGASPVPASIPCMDVLAAKRALIDLERRIARKTTALRKQRDTLLISSGWRRDAVSLALALAHVDQQIKRIVASERGTATYRTATMPKRRCA